jgi:hypothetical protein
VTVRSFPIHTLFFTISSVFLFLLLFLLILFYQSLQDASQYKKTFCIWLSPRKFKSKVTDTPPNEPKRKYSKKLLPQGIRSVGERFKKYSDDIEDDGKPSFFGFAEA